uniref:Unkown protein n=1 Tax=Riptortus pedestris TaxID=329032 RepID=R4WTY6_RIPPE|nr:unkown protein [Riptortus pedestris]
MKASRWKKFRDKRLEINGHLKKIRRKLKKKHFAEDTEHDIYVYIYILEYGEERRMFNEMWTMKFFFN